MDMNANRAYDLTNRLSFVRVAGTAEERRAADILLEEIKSIGLDGELLPFEFEDADVARADFEVLAPYQKKYEVTGVKRGAATAPEGIELEFQYVEDAMEANLVDARGKFVLLNAGPAYKTYEKLAKAGVKGYMGYSGLLNDRIEETDLDVRKLRPQISDEFGALTGLTIRVRDAVELVRMGASRVRVTLQNENITRVSHNVRAVIPGTDRPDEMISFGAHYDSVPFSSGAYDNASGSAILMELARYFHEHRPSRTLEFVWYGAEEQGLLGSKHYVHNRGGALDKCVLMVNVDLAGTTLGKEVAWVTGDMCVVNFVDALMKQLGLAAEVKQEIYSSDSIPFADRGIPAVNFARFAAQGAAYGHNRFDTMEAISPDGLKRTMENALAFSERMANAKVFPFERTQPKEMVEKVDEYLLKKK